ncbi:3'-5' exonuclease [Paenibacillus algicola]|uniref:3'-5' exonuclease n=1 Tax=Paenibacillus algicola TaxID=2565926 RepID=UPI0010FD4E8A|nr:3'-5' exonuclease [Paenibacillus algicola]
MESRILGDKYVRFGGEFFETCFRDEIRREGLTYYRFRLAEPGLFLDKYKTYASVNEADEAELRQGARIDLARNFRSRMEVVDAVNMLFRQIMNESVAEIQYDSRAELVCGAAFPAVEKEAENAASPFGMHTPELLLIDRENADSSGSSIGLEDAAGSDAGEGMPAEESERQEMETAQLEARAIAVRIREMMGDTGKPLLVFDKVKKAMRPVEYGDIVILLRSASVWAPLMMEELVQEGIPASGEQNRGYFQAVEVEIMLSLLRVIDNPRQDIPLASVLRSPIVGLTEEELAQVRLFAAGSYYDALSAALEQATMEAAPGGTAGLAAGRWNLGLELSGTAEAAAGQSLSGAQPAEGVKPGPGQPAPQPELSAGLAAKLISFRDRLESWRLDARHGSLSDLIWRIYSETGYLDWLGGLPGGSQRQSNLTALYDRAVQYEQDTSSRGLFRFLTFISRMRDNGGDLGAGSKDEGQGNAVRFMTIHKSKGLEFPVVFVAGLSKNFNQQDLNAAFLMHKELGFGPKYVDGKLRVSYPTLPNLAIRRRSHLELLAEEMRVLYVALTRPKEKLILIGTVKKLLNKIKDWSQVDSVHGMLLPDYMLARGRSYMDWIGPAILRHPSAAILREAAELPETGHADLFPGADSWMITVKSDEYLMTGAPRHQSHAAEGPGSAEQERREGIEAALNRLEPVQDIPWESGQSPQEMREELYRRISWKYPYLAASGIAAKTSVTEMKKQLAMQEHPPREWAEEALQQEGSNGNQAGSFTLSLRRPKFMEDYKLTPTERGTVYHTVMQHVPLVAGLDSAAVEELLNQLTDKELITREQAEAVQPQDIVDMLASSAGEMLLQASQVWREMPFSYALPATEAYLLPDPASGPVKDALHVQELLQEECVLIQGVVDCLFRQDERLILLDYKTDKVLEQRGGIEALKEQYRFQLELYAKALEEILGEPIQEKWLYFFDAGQAVQL